MTTTTLKKSATKAIEQELVIIRVFDAPREQVWKAWTEPEIMKRWKVPFRWNC
jgi:uncharacterized protein YndB with AHSA1/START domain